MTKTELEKLLSRQVTGYKDLEPLKMELIKFSKKQGISIKDYLKTNMNLGIYGLITEDEFDLLSKVPTTNTGLIKLLSGNDPTTPEVQLDFAKKALGKTFLMFEDYSTDGLVQFYRIMDMNTQKLSERLDLAAFLSQGSGVIAKYSQGKSMVLASRVLQECMKTYKDYSTKEVGTPANYLPPNKAGWCLNRGKIEPIEGKFPAWQSVLDRLTDPDFFMAWLAGVYTNQYKGRKMIWIQGSYKTGKSHVLRAIEEGLFGKSACCAVSTQNTDKHSMAAYYGKKLAVDGDITNARFIGTKVARHLLSGGKDSITVDEKHQKPFIARLEVNVFGLSNYVPILNSDGAESSRVEILQLSRFTTPEDVNFDEKLIAELPAFLYKGIQLYKELCPDNGNIRANERSLELLEQCTTGDLSFQILFDNLFKVNEVAPKGDRITLKDLADFTHSLKVVERERFQQWLFTKYETEFKSHGGRNPARQISTNIVLKDYRPMTGKINTGGM